MDIKKKFAGDFSLTFIGLVIYNGALQFLVYPLLSKRLGNTAYGEVLYYISIFAITSVALGLASSNTRLVQRNNYSISNADCTIYNFAVLFVMSIAVGILLFCQKVAFIDAVMVLVIQILMALRYYTEVIYKINVNFKKYLVFYVAVTAGYVVGAIIFNFINLWWIPFVFGETAGIAFSLLATDLKHKPFTGHDNFAKFTKSTTPLLISYLLYYLVMNLDRIILRNMLGSDSVGPYYTATLIGKTAAMIVSPLSGVIIGYLTNEDSKINKKLFTKFNFIVVAGGLLFFGLTLIGTPIFTKLFYPEYYKEVLKIMVLVNFGQVMCFVSELILNVVLTFKHEKWQMIIQIVYAVVFIVLAIAMVHSVGVLGMAIATAVANAIRLILAIVIGYFDDGSKKEIAKVN
ncbi:MAG: hypothetical protein PUE60_05995 [Eubacteriales bacterium]|nr:hypothetical protein [Eubacteriales bacterium]